MISEINVLQSIEDARARECGHGDAETVSAVRRKVIAEIEKESLDKTGLRSDVVTLWQGGTYHLYRYKRYTDVRVVFAPEQQIAFFGDPTTLNIPVTTLTSASFAPTKTASPPRRKTF